MSRPDELAERALGCVDALGTSPPREALEAAAEALARLDLRALLTEPSLVRARGSEERLYALGRRAPEGPALYLVSDAPGVASPPHEHRTWAIVVGLEGIERNHRFVRTSASSREVRADGRRDIGPGEWMSLGVEDVHATEVVSDSATMHLHVYGRALDTLPPFAARCFSPRP
ncbi:MAG: hypothetical protein U0234_25790 [Sandaracinus sp.]